MQPLRFKQAIPIQLVLTFTKKFAACSHIVHILAVYASFVDEKINLADIKWEDVHVATGALKMFFRELPEPLFTYDHFNDFLSAISK